MSVLLRPDMKASESPMLTMICSIAAARAVEKCGGLRCGLKWPNDIVLNGRKVGGILVETETEGEIITSAVAGFGLNVNVCLSALPGELRDTATSLWEHLGVETRLADLAGSLIRRLEQYLRRLPESAGAGEAEWLEREYADMDGLSGKVVRVQQGERVIQGPCAGVDARGFLLVSAGGTTHAIPWCDSVIVLGSAGR